MSALGERLRQLRNEMGLSQQNLSDRLEIPRTTISSWESGNRTPELGAIEKLADYFNVSIDYLVGRIDARNPVDSKYIVDKVYKAIQDDPELGDFVDKLTQRKELQLIFKTIRNISQDEIYKLMRVVDALGFSKEDKQCS